jgi:hypothetical protein
MKVWTCLTLWPAFSAVYRFFSQDPAEHLRISQHFPALPAP